MANSPSDLFTLIPPRKSALPIFLSVPHSGIKFPKDDFDRFKNEAIATPEDTDWFVDQLYSFAPELGIGMIVANYSRYVIDLNRDPKNTKLYQDGRAETALIPSTTFSGKPLYNQTPDFREDIVHERLENFYWPYYEQIKSSLNDLKEEFKQVLFFDAHSIRRFVPSIRSQPFPDLILGNQDGKTCSDKILSCANKCLSEGKASYKVSINEPFKGGHLTRYFGSPSSGIHALQLEMSQDGYMDEDKILIEEDRFKKMQTALKNMMMELAVIVERI